jgi:DNA modification methylase
MFEENKIYNQDCLLTMNDLPEKCVDLIITSPPYNSTPRRGGPADKGRYDVYRDWKSEEEYINWTIEIFKGYDKVVKNNRVVLYNFSYTIENPTLPYKLVSEIANNTNWELADTIIWKKKTAIPHPASYNRLHRVYEFVWVFVRKNEMKTFIMPKKIKKVSKSDQKYYEIIENFIEAINNDGSNKLNKATFSTDLVKKLIKMYGFSNDVVYDSFMGVGTTALGSIEMNCKYIGSEISLEQCILSENKIKEKMSI